MDDLPTERESRYLVSPAEARGFLARVAGHAALDVHDPVRPFAFVRSTYFDSDEHELFRSQPRRRVLLREYAGAPVADGVPSLTGACAFEVVESSDGVRRKARINGGRAALLRLLRRGPDRPLDLALARAALQVTIGRLRPRLTTFFRRLSFTGDRLRVTLDDRLAFARPVRLGGTGELAEPPDPVGRSPQLILAVKLADEPPAWLRAATADLLVVTRFSRFRDGILAIARADALGGDAAAGSRDSILSPP